MRVSDHDDKIIGLICKYDGGIFFTDTQSPPPPPVGSN